MFKIRLILLSLLVVLATSLAVSTSASALGFWVCKNVTHGRFETHKCKNAGGNNEWETKQLIGTETAGVAGTGGPAKLEGEIVGQKVTIECKKSTVVGTLEAEGRSKGESSNTECSQTGLGTKCAVREPIVFKFTDQLVGTLSKVEDELKATGAEEVLFTLEISGSECASKGKFKVKGTQTCSFVNPEASGAEHEIECTPAGSKLKLATSPAFLTCLHILHEIFQWAWGFDK